MLPNKKYQRLILTVLAIIGDLQVARGNQYASGNQLMQIAHGNTVIQT
jgi:hypothetical protein